MTTFKSRGFLLWVCQAKGKRGSRGLKIRGAFSGVGNGQRRNSLAAIPGPLDTVHVSLQATLIPAFH